MMTMKRRTTTTRTTTITRVSELWNLIETWGFHENIKDIESINLNDGDNNGEHNEEENNKDNNDDKGISALGLKENSNKLLHGLKPLRYMVVARKSSFWIFIQL